MKLIGALLAGALGLGIAPAARAQCLGCFSPSFEGAVRAYPPAPAGIVSADFDGDGVPDVVVLGADTLEFMKGTGSGSLAPPVSRPAPPGPGAIVTADFNGDGYADVATATENKVSVYLGNGNGTFADPIDTTANLQANYVLKTADFNGDGVPDLVVTAFIANGTLVYLGNGDGTLAPPLVVPVAAGALAVGDFDGDGRPDIAASVFPDSVVVFLNDGAGGFSDARTTTGVSYGSLAAGDFNGDGDDDLVMFRFYDVAVLIGNGDGTFTLQVVHDGEYGPSTGIVEDYNDDGHLDISFTFSQHGAITRLPGHGDGTFGPEASLIFGDQLSTLVGADFDGSGSHDLAVVSNAGYVQIMLADASGAFSLPSSFDPGAGAGPIAAAGNFMGSGRLDLVTLGNTSTWIVPNQGAAVFGAPIDLGLADDPIHVAVGDFAAGGGTDLAVSTLIGIQMVVSNGDGTFQAGAPFSSASWLAAADFDGDGKLDLAWVNGDLLVALGNGDGTLAPATSYSGLGGYALVAADFDNDTFPDIAITYPDHFTVMRNDGSGGFTQGATYGPWYNDLTRITAGDFDGDGNVDVAVTLYGINQLFIYWGLGDGTFTAEPPLTPTGNPLGLDAVDVNGDGRPELVVSGAQTAQILTFHPDRTFETYQAVKPTIIAGTVLADMDQDGKPDLTFVGGVAQTAYVFRNSICEPRRLALATQPASCDAPGSAFATQPVLHVLDDGDNLVTCDDPATVFAAIVPATGAAGAVLGGQTAAAVNSGVAAFSDLSIDLAGRGYRLAFTRAPFSTRSRTLTQGLTAGIVGPAEVCTTSEAAYRSASSGYDRVQWILDGAPVSRTERVSFDSLAPGTHELELHADQDACTAQAAIAIEVETTQAPVIVAPDTARVGATGLVASVAYHGGSRYNWTLLGGTLTGGQGTSQVTFDAGAPGTAMRLSVVEQPITNCVSPEADATVLVDFADVPPENPFHAAIAVVTAHGITAGCGGGQFCWQSPMTRAQAAVLLLKAIHGPSYVPFPASGIFADVPPGSFAADWIEALVGEAIAAGCGGGNFCPNAPVTRAQASVWLLKAEHGGDYSPPVCTGVFADVSCVPPEFAVEWIEQLYDEGATGGCSADPLLFCPDAAVTRGQAAALIVRTFNLE
ncbi:MAG TPA: FG-GAP-like repeat-containing protein [Thermoanaerobaculia bacterium]|nr:FG-GAP-like repeat-containing protein [Thermoanaerobaculia bacterium]